MGRQTQCQHGPATRSGRLLIDGARSLYLASRVLHNPWPLRRLDEPYISSEAPLKRQMTLRPTLGVCFSLFNSLNLPIFFPRPSTSVPSSSLARPTLSLILIQPCNTQGANTPPMAQVTLASRHTHIPVSTISSRHSRSNINTRASSNNTDQPPTRGLFHFPNHPLIPFPPASQSNSQSIAHHVHRLHTRL